MSTSTLFQSLLNACVASLKGSHGPSLLFVIHFGSTARGNLKNETDLDLFVCLKELPLGSASRNAFAYELETSVQPFTDALAAQGYQIHVSSLFRSSSGIKTFSPLHLDLATEGVLLFDRTEEGKTFLDAVRKRMKERGTVRKRIGMKWYWSNV
jgi:predicted nucleotidyltransferase